MKRRLAAGALCALAPLGVALTAPAGAGVPTQHRSHAQVEASALRHQLRVERLRAQRAFREMRRILMARPDVNAAIHLAAITYGVDEGRMRRIIWRESRFRPWAKNSHSTASGLAQFLDGTWASTPQGRAGLSVFDPYANAMAMAWVVANRGWGDWSLTSQ